jgi:pseudouridine-5'-phosphate glycosidase
LTRSRTDDVLKGMDSIPSWLSVSPDVAAALRERRPVVALESSLIAHGLPPPQNLQAARLVEQVIREEGAMPVTIAVIQGEPTVGLRDDLLEQLAQPKVPVLKLSRRDLPVAMAQRKTGATTVAATMHLAHCAGIRVFATGGIGGVHRGDPSDVSADLIELSRTPLAVVCAGAKTILDVRRTLEMLETLGVPVIGYGTDEFAGFSVRSSGEPVSASVDTVAEAAALLAAHWQLGGAGAVVAQPLPAEQALSAAEFEAALQIAEERAAAQKVRGPKLTPFLLAQLADLTKGKTLAANVALVEANARLAAQIAAELHRQPA